LIYLIPGGNKYKNSALDVGAVSKIQTINYAHESRGNQTRKGLLWRGAATIENCRPDLNKPATV
jgi:hypothetical protein